MRVGAEFAYTKEWFFAGAGWELRVCCGGGVLWGGGGGGGGGSISSQARLLPYGMLSGACPACAMK